MTIFIKGIKLLQLNVDSRGTHLVLLTQDQNSSVLSRGNQSIPWCLVKKLQSLVFRQRNYGMATKWNCPKLLRLPKVAVVTTSLSLLQGSVMITTVVFLNYICQHKVILFMINQSIQVKARSGSGRKRS